jgi:Holliday junction resolvase RusA-like endonuclease
MVIMFEFNFQLISVNKLYVNIRGQARRFLSTEGKKFKGNVEQVVNNFLSNEKLLSMLSSFKGKKLTVKIKIESAGWLLKDRKSISRTDLSNKEKAITDSIFKTFVEHGINLDDKQIFKLEMEKIVSDVERTTYIIEEYIQQ